MKLKKLWLMLSLGALLVNTIECFAQTAQERGREIASKEIKKDDGFGNQVVDVEMILKNQHGQTSTRLMKTKTLEMKDDGDKTLVIFKEPKDVKGTVFLSFTHIGKPDDQWLYLPALRRVKRITSNNKSGPFVGSEFAYEEITSRELEKYKYKYLRDEDYQGQKTHVLEQYPVYEHSGYTRQIAWIDQKEFRLLKTEFYDRKNALLKTLTFEGYNKRGNGKWWRVDRMHMINHQNGKSTVLSYKNYRFNNKLTARDFDKNALKRVR